MNIYDAIDIMESVAGVTDESTPIGEAWAAILRHIGTTSVAHPPLVAIPGEEYHEDMGSVTWWRLPVEEPPWVGTPNDSDWPGYHTHFTPAPAEPLNANGLPLPGEVEHG